MAWTVETALKVYLAETGDLQGAMAGGSANIKFYADNAGSPGTHLATCTITSATAPGTGATVLTVSPGTVLADGTAVHAKIFAASDGTTAMLSTNNVGDVGGENINFDETTWVSTNTVSPGAITLTLASMTAS